MIYEKRGKWCFRDSNGKLHKFTSKDEAETLYNSLSPSIKIEMPKVEKPSEEEEKDSEEEASTDEQEIVFESESGSEETF